MTPNSKENFSAAKMGREGGSQLSSLGNKKRERETRLGLSKRE
jgi:hypothetical protein